MRATVAAVPDEHQFDGRRLRDRKKRTAEQNTTVAINVICTAGIVHAIIKVRTRTKIRRLLSRVKRKFTYVWG